MGSTGECPRGRSRISTVKVLNGNRTGARCEQNPGEIRVHYAGTGRTAVNSLWIECEYCRHHVVNP